MFLFSLFRPPHIFDVSYRYLSQVFFQITRSIMKDRIDKKRILSQYTKESEAQNNSLLDDDAKYVGSALAQSEQIVRYGAAIKEDIVSYTGVDNATGQVLKKSLKSIHNAKVNPNDAARNIKQQAGFSAEVEEVKRANKNAILKGSKTRTVRTDDIGRVNDQLYDYVQIDKNGNEIPGSGVQLKFIGKNGNDWFNKFTSKKSFQKYIDNDVKIGVPKDYYEDIQNAADNRLAKLQKQLTRARTHGNIDVEKKIQAKIDNIKTLKKNLRQSSVTSTEATEAKLNPQKITFKDMNSTAMDAAKDSAMFTGAFVGSLSLLENGIKVFQGKCSVEEALKDSAIKTAKGGVIGYASGYGASMISGVMQNSSNTIIRTLGKTPLPQAVVVPIVLGFVKATSEYLQGNITGKECLTLIGKTGLTSAGGVAYGAIGQLLIPIPVVGGLIGGMVGIALGNACHNQLVKALNEAKLAHEERLRIEEECEETIRTIRAYREQVNTIVKEYLADYQTTFDEAFLTIEHSIAEGDADGVIQGANQISKKLGGEPEFNTVEEFDVLMKDDKPLKL